MQAEPATIATIGDDAMTSNLNTSIAAEATISERELFHEFAQIGSNRSDPLTSQGGATPYTLENLVNEANSTDFSDELISLINSVFESDEPGWEMESMAMQLASFAQVLEETGLSFVALQSLRSVELNVSTDHRTRYKSQPANSQDSAEGVGSSTTREFI